MQADATQPVLMPAAPRPPGVPVSGLEEVPPGMRARTPVAAGRPANAGSRTSRGESRAAADAEAAGQRRAVRQSPTAVSDADETASIATAATAWTVETPGGGVLESPSVPPPDAHDARPLLGGH
jgi:hypothetical protein